MSAPKKPKTNEEILKEALGEIRYKLNGSVTNSQLVWAMKEAVSQERSRILGLMQEEINQWSFINESSKEAIESIKTKIKQG